jgi:hypothetical protein
VIGGVLVLIALNVGLALDVALKPGVRDPMFDLPAEHYKTRVDAAGNKPVTVVFLGSSRTGYGIRPAIVEQTLAEAGTPCLAYNLHVLANGPIGEMVHWQRLVERDMIPDVVVLEICPPRFSTFTQNQPGTTQAAEPKKKKLSDDMVTFRGDRMTWDEVQLVEHYGFPDETEKDWREANWNPWFGFRFQIMGMLNPMWLPNNVTHHERRPASDLGWKRPFYEKWAPDKYELAIEANKRLLYERMQNIDFDESPAQCFRDLVRSIKEHHSIPVAFVTPEASVIRAWYPPEVNKRIDQFIQELREKFQIEVVDLRAALPDEAFHDGHHAVLWGADEYSRAVAKAVLVKAVEQAQAKKQSGTSMAVSRDAESSERSATRGPR